MGMHPNYTSNPSQQDYSAHLYTWEEHNQTKLQVTERRDWGKGKHSRDDIVRFCFICLSPYIPPSNIELVAILVIGIDGHHG